MASRRETHDTEQRSNNRMLCGTNKTQAKIATLWMLCALIAVMFTGKYYLKESECLQYSYQQMTPETVTSCPPFSSWSLFRGLANFTQDNTDCQVKADEKLRTYTSSGKPPCSPRAFRNYFATNGRFYGSGHWSNSSIQSAVFEAEECSFSESFFGDGSLRRYLIQENIKHILVSGDSNGDRFASSVLKLIKNEFTTCQKTRQTQKLNSSRCFDTDYFDIPNFPMGKLRGQDKGCSSSPPYVYECTYDNFTFKMEFIGLTHLTDSSLRVDYSLEGPFQMRRFGASTLVEFLLKYYFKHWGYPDVWAIYAPNMHETWDRDYPTFKLYADMFRQFLSLYMPDTSRTIVTAAHRECPAKQPRGLLEAVRKYKLFETSRNEKIHKMNQILFNVLKPDLLNPESNILGFLDLAEISCPVSCDWHADGAHMLTPWYDKIASYMFQFIMNDI